MKNLIHLFVLTALVVPAPLVAANGFEQWKQQQQAGFEQYRDRQDKEFAAFLNSHWIAIELLQGEQRDSRPKPVAIPVATPGEDNDAARLLTPQTPVKAQAADTPLAATAATNNIPQPAVTGHPRMPATATPVQTPGSVPEAGAPPQAALSRKPPPAPVARAARRLNVSFFGEQLSVFIDPHMRIAIPHRLDRHTISTMWLALARSNYPPLIEQLQSIRQQHGLNDWAFVVLVNQLSRNMAAADTARTMLNWFILVKSGYQARVAYNDDRLTLLLPSQQSIYATPYFMFDGKRFYALSFDGKPRKADRLYTYDGNYPGADKALDMHLGGNIIKHGREQIRKLHFSYQGKRYSIDARYNRERVRFLNTYPQLDLAVYFSARFAEDSAGSLRSQLSTHIKGMSQLQAVNFLLRFVQTALPYKTDEQQFGRENTLFPEETLYYRYSDCEDRAVLFVWLVRNLLGLDVIGLDYPGHVATAVLFTVPVDGDAVMFNGNKYTVTDPTYINAVAGMSMPQYRDIRPVVITME